MTKKERWREAVKVYYAMVNASQRSPKLNNRFVCQSWWINPKNDPELNMPTSKINQRAKLLVKEGYLEIQSKHTSTSTGTSYTFTDKIPIKYSDPKK